MKIILEKTKRGRFIDAYLLIESFKMRRPYLVGFRDGTLGEVSTGVLDNPNREFLRYEVEIDVRHENAVGKFLRDERYGWKHSRLWVRHFPTILRLLKRGKRNLQKSRYEKHLTHPAEFIFDALYIFGTRLHAHALDGPTGYEPYELTPYMLSTSGRTYYRQDLTHARPYHIQ